MGILATATVDIVPNLRPLTQGLQQARVELDRFARTGGGGAAGVGYGVFGVGLAASIAGAVKKSADLAEIMNKVRVTFGTTGGSGVIAQANDLADKFGLVKKSTLDAAANFGLFGQAAGLSKDQSAEFAKQLVVLGADLASFHDISRELAFEKLESGLAGEVRPLREIGIFLSEDAVKAKALAMGLGQVGRELTDQEKIRARFTLIMEQAGPARGDLERTASSIHNQMLKAQGDLENLITSIGSDFEPALLSAINLTRELGQTLQKAFAGPGGKSLIKEFSSDLTKAIDEFRDMNAIVKSNQSLSEKASGIWNVLFSGTTGGRATPGSIANVLREKPVPRVSVPNAAEVRERQIAGTMADFEAARRRSSGIEERAARVLTQMRVQAPIALNMLRNFTSGAIAPMMGGGRIGGAFQAGLKKVFGEVKPPEVQMYQDQIDSLKDDLKQEKLIKAARQRLGISDQPSMMFADPAEYARAMIQGILGKPNDQVKAIEDSIKVLEEIRDKLPGQEKVDRRRGVFPIG